MQILLWTDLEIVGFLHVLDPLVCLALWIDHQRPAVRIGYNNCVIKRKTESGNHKARIRKNPSWRNPGLKVLSRYIEDTKRLRGDTKFLFQLWKFFGIFKRPCDVFFLLFKYQWNTKPFHFNDFFRYPDVLQYVKELWKESSTLKVCICVWDIRKVNLTLSLPNVPKGKFRPNLHISFSKIVRNK